MPRITEDRIVWLYTDRNIFQEESVDITQTGYSSLFNGAQTNGDTTQYYKFLEEIVEKDPDIQHAIATRTSMVTSKEWMIEGPEQGTADRILEALLDIKGDASQGLLDVDQLINAFLGSAYLTGLSVNEVVTDDSEIIGFNHVPSHFLTFMNTVHYPKLYTQEQPTGVEFNKDKMVVHYLNPGGDPVRGFLGHSIGWQYVFKTSNLEQQLKWQTKYGKPFLLINMDTERDGYENDWSTAEALVQNLYNVDGAVFGGGVEAEMVDPGTQEGDYFFDSGNEYKKNIVKIILGQESTSSSEDSNRSTAEVHQDILEQRILNDLELIESTMTTQLLPKVADLLNVDATKYNFKFIVSQLEEDIDEDQASDEDQSITNDIQEEPEE